MVPAPFPPQSSSHSLPFRCRNQGSGSIRCCDFYQFIELTEPLHNMSMAFALSARFMPARHLIDNVLSWNRIHQLSAFAAASLVQWIRDCWPAPSYTFVNFGCLSMLTGLLTPITCPLTAKQTELLWVYLAAMVATVRSRRADSGRGGESLGVIMFLKLSCGEIRASLRCWDRWTP